MTDHALNPISPLPTRPSTWRVWLQAVRIFSFTASAIPIFVAAAMALVDREFDPVLFIAMLLASIVCQAGANLANDYFDHIKGIDTDESLGPSKVIQQGLLTPAQVKRGMVVAFAVATVLGLFIVWRSDWVVLALALLSLGAAYFYTGGPKPLGYIALGELTVFIFMGPVMIGGAYYVFAGTITWQVILVSLAVASLVALILHANNVRDIDFDARAGKTTLATLFGRRIANHEYALLTAIAYIAVLLLVAIEPRWWPTLVVGATLPTAVELTRLCYTAADVNALNGLLRRSAGLHLRFGSALTVGILLRALLDRV